MNIPYTYSSYIWPSIVSSYLLIVLAVFSLRNRKVPGAIPFTFACVFGLLWSLALVLEFSAVDTEVKIFWRKFGVVWQLPSSTAITFFLLEYARPKRWLTRRNLILLSIIPLLVILSIVTNDAHHLFWKGFTFDNGLVADLGPIAQYALVYFYLLSLLNLIILVWLFIRSPENRWPIAIMIIGQIILRLFYFSDIAGRARYNFSYTAVGLAFISLIYAVVLFRFRILGPMSLARKVVIEQIPIGMLVLDHQLKINSLNPIAERMLKVSGKTVKNKQIRDVLDAYPIDTLNENGEYHLEFKFSLDNKVCDYLLSIIQLKDWRDDHVGQLLLLTDVTEQRYAQAKILEQQRVLATLKERELLARELHDDLAQVFAFIDTQGQTIQRLLNRGDLKTADQYLTRLVEAARDGEVDIRETIRVMRMNISKHGLLATLENYLLQFEANTSIHTDLIKMDNFDINLVNPMVEVQLLRILQEALNNIRKHAQADHVMITFESIDNSICIAVQDNGCGFDLSEKDFDPEKHFGLHMMRERAEVIGGTISFSSQPGQGTLVKVCLPIANQMEIG